MKAGCHHGAASRSQGTFAQVFSSIMSQHLVSCMLPPPASTDMASIIAATTRHRYDQHVPHKYSLLRSLRGCHLSPALGKASDATHFPTGKKALQQQVCTPTGTSLHISAVDKHTSLLSIHLPHPLKIASGILWAVPGFCDSERTDKVITYTGRCLHVSHLHLRAEECGIMPRIPPLLTSLTCR